MALLDAAQYFYYMAKRCGYKPRIIKNRFEPNVLNIIFCAHLLSDFSTLPQDAIIFNSEPIGDARGLFNSAEYRKKLEPFYVWDYSPDNINNMECRKKALIPFYYCKELDCITRKEKSIELLFYGSLSARRLQLLNEIKAKGVNVVSLFGLYGPELAAHIAASRAVLNLHHFEGQPLEQLRCFFPLTNSVPVVSERYRTESAPPGYERSLFLPADEPLAEFVARTLANRAEFKLEAFRRIEHFRSLDPLPEFAAALEAALGSSRAQRKLGEESVVPTMMNLGCGSGYRLGYLNVDPDPAANPDVVLDLSEPVTWPKSVSSRYGKIVLGEGMFDEVTAKQVLQYVADMRRVMDHCLRLLKSGGRMEIEVPYELSLSAWNDSRCRRAFNETSWSEFTEKFWNMGWLDYRFDCVTVKYASSALGRQMELSGNLGDEILRVPRAVDTMSLTLVKRPTTDEEKQLARTRHPNFHLTQE